MRLLAVNFILLLMNLQIVPLTSYFKVIFSEEIDLNFPCEKGTDATRFRSYYFDVSNFRVLLIHVASSVLQPPA